MNLSLKKQQDGHCSIAYQNKLSSLNENEYSEEWFICVFCKSKVVKQSDAVEVNGAHEYSFVNPSGIKYHIRCFKDVVNVQTIGSPTEENSWFKGYAWSIADCAVCGMHLGWEFSSGSDLFCGFVSDYLAKES